MLIYLAFLASFGLNCLILPKFISVAGRHGKLFKTAVSVAYDINVPTHGGIPVFLVFWLVSLCSLLFTGLYNHSIIILIFSTTLILLTGMMGSLGKISNSQKILVELFSISIMILFYYLKINLITSLLGTNIFTESLTIIFTIIAGFVIINSINFIDSIDTMCTGIVITILVPISIWFYSTGEIAEALMGSALIGSLFAFGKFNSLPSKLSLGESGSLFLGLFVAFMVFKFWESNGTMLNEKSFMFPALTAIGMMLVPVTDFFSVIFERIKKGKSIFLTDRSHLHYKLIGYGFSNNKSTNILLMINSASIAFVIIFKDFSWFFQLAILIIFAVGIRTIIFKYSENRKFEYNHLKDKVA